MRICVTSQADTLDSQVDPRFGRCPYFMIVDTETMDFEAVQNPNVTGMGGVGVQSGQLMSEKKVKAVLTGNVGPNAFRTLKAGGIDIYAGVSGTVKEAVQKYKNGGLKPVDDASVDSKFGMG
ncbi:MAG: dinitrogenase iron-molybdenum cofactor biosynthesis protein [Candidatus Omnitrophica bacterium]|nr:dinitrogenase iron-molybdenum cofactor biosynthesis protein [Candidatus Omnitrophota bacterium]